MLPSSRLWIQMFNLNIHVYVTLKLTVQLSLALIYGIFFNSVIPTYLISKPTPVSNTLINKSLFTDKRTRKITSVANSIPSKCLKFASSCLESSSAICVKYPYRQLRSVLGFLQKISWWAKGGHKKPLFQQYDFPFNFHKSVSNTSLKQHPPRKTKIEEIPEYKFFENIEDLSIRSFWYHIKWHQAKPLDYALCTLSY